MDAYEMEQADKSVWEKYRNSTNAREVCWAGETSLDPATLVESQIDPALFTFADWPNSFKDFEYPCVPCAMCGHNIRWGVGFRHVDGDLIYVGEDCADYLDADNIVEKKLKQFKTAQKNKAEKLAQEAEWKNRRAEMVANDEDVCEFLSATEEAEHAYREAEKPTNLKAPMPFMMDMVHAWNKWGSLTENQLKAVKKIMVKQAEYEAKKAAEPKPTTPLAEGRNVLTGTIVSVKWVENDFGGSEKMLVVLSDYNKVYGSIPKSIRAECGQYEELKGKTVEFTATVTRSNDDEHFGFFSKPAKGSVIS